MARNKGQFVFAANFEVKAAAALDPRVAVATKAELFIKDTWPHDGGDPYLYDGLVVGVVDEQAVYMLVDRSKYNEEAGWLRVDAGNAEQIEVIDNLDSDRTDAALSAKQGKALKVLLGSKADLGTDGKIKSEQLPDYILGQVLFGGLIEYDEAGQVYHISASETAQKKYPDLAGAFVADLSAVNYEGVYFISNVNGKLDFAAGSLDVSKGDWVISNGTEWAKIDNSDAVTSVAGLDGNITAEQLADKLKSYFDESGAAADILENSTGDDYIVVGANAANNGLEITAGQSLKAIETTANEAKGLATGNKSSLDALSIAVGNINLTLNGNDDDTDDIPNQLGIVGRLEAVEELIGQPTDDDKTTTMLSRLNALEELVTGGESGEGEGDQTLLQKVNQNTLDITALETTVYGADNKSGLVKTVEKLNGDASTVGSVDYKIEHAIEEAFAWEDVE